MTRRSSGPLALLAAATPAGIPTTTPRAMAVAVRSSVAGRRSSTTWIAGRLNAKELPKSPRATWLTYRAYWTGSG